MYFSDLSESSLVWNVKAVAFLRISFSPWDWSIFATGKSDMVGYPFYGGRCYVLNLPFWDVCCRLLSKVACIDICISGISGIENGDLLGVISFPYGTKHAHRA